MNDMVPLILGAFLAILGGGIGDEIRAWRDRKRELDSIKISIGDELLGIEDTINRMNEVWKEAQVLSSSYNNDLLENTGAFDSLRSRLFLIKDQFLRKSISSFYKKFKDALKKSKGKFGTLASSPEAKQEQEKLNIEFQAFASESKNIREGMEK